MLRDRLLGHRQVAYAVVTWGIIVSLWPAPAIGSPVSAQLSQGDHSQGDIEVLRQVLETKASRERLEALGLTPAEVEAKLSRFSPEELHELAQRAVEIGAGGQEAIPIAPPPEALIVLAVLLILAIVGLVLTVWRVTTSPRETPTPTPGPLSE